MVNFLQERQGERLGSHRVVWAALILPQGSVSSNARQFSEEPAWQPEVYEGKRFGNAQAEHRLEVRGFLEER